MDYIAINEFILCAKNLFSSTGIFYDFDEKKLVLKGMMYRRNIEFRKADDIIETLGFVEYDDYFFEEAIKGGGIELTFNTFYFCIDFTHMSLKSLQ